MTSWKSSRTPPDPDREVLVFCENSGRVSWMRERFYSLAVYRDDRRWYDSQTMIVVNVLHWMPLPEEPKETT